MSRSCITVLEAGDSETHQGVGCMQVPLALEIRQTSDSGAPIVVSQPESPSAQVYQSIAAEIKAKVLSGTPQTEVQIASET